MLIYDDVVYRASTIYSKESSTLDNLCQKHEQTV